MDHLNFKRVAATSSVDWAAIGDMAERGVPAIEAAEELGMGRQHYSVARDIYLLQRQPNLSMQEMQTLNNAFMLASFKKVSEAMNVISEIKKRRMGTQGPHRGKLERQKFLARIRSLTVAMTLLEKEVEVPWLPQQDRDIIIEELADGIKAARNILKAVKKQGGTTDAAVD